MGSFREALTEGDKRWINKQKISFVATAPLSKNGHVNCSPRGYDTLRIINSNRIIMLDGNGSGCETISHLRENSRITIMMCSFDGSPRIMRFFGTGRVFEPGSKEFEAYFDQHFKEEWGAKEKQSFVRSIIEVDIHLVGQSCGFAVPFMEYKGERDTLWKYYDKRSEEQALKSRQKNNTLSIDGIPSYLDRTEGPPWYKSLGCSFVPFLPWIGGASIGMAATLALVKK